MNKKDLYKDLEVNLRKTEETECVVRRWGTQEDPYVFNVHKENRACYDCYCRIMAEYVFYRKKILSLRIDKSLENKDVLSARPFGDNGPTLQELLSVDVKAAMAYVPLTGQVDVKAVLARLYCVTGLEVNYSFPFDSPAPDCSTGKAWFLAGLRSDEKPPTGCSWHLAASLLTRVFESKTAKENLATKFIVTGEVDGHRVGRVEIGHKTELNKCPEFQKLTWIVPEDNRLDLKNTMENAMKVQYPKTLEEAYEMIKTLDVMRNNDTRVLFNMASSKEQNVEDMVRLLKNGANPCEMMDKGLNTHQELVGAMERKLAECRGHKGEVSNEEMSRLVNQLDDFLQKKRVLSYYAGIPQIFFFFAHNRNQEMIKRLHDLGVDINSTDMNGETALDFAESVGEKETVEILVRSGATLRGRYSAKSHHMKSLLRHAAKNGEFSDAEKNFIKEALANGLDVNADIDFSLSPLVNVVRTKKTPLWDGKDIPPCTTKVEIFRRRTNFFTEMLLLDKNKDGELIKLCMIHGADQDHSIDCYCGKASEFYVFNPLDPDEDPQEVFLDFAPGDHPVPTPRQLVQWYIDSWSLESLRALMNSQKS